MEIREIISFYINTTNEVLEVDFRLTEDGDDEMRTDEVPLSELTEYGFKFEHEHIDIESEDDFDDMSGLLDEDFDIDSDINMEELLPFLNEYYTVNPDKLPDVYLF